MHDAHMRLKYKANMRHVALLNCSPKTEHRSASTNRYIGDSLFATYVSFCIFYFIKGQEMNLHEWLAELPGTSSVPFQH